MKAARLRAARVPEGGLVLQRGGFLHLHEPLGWCIECVSGSAWITQDGDPHDTLLDPGQRHVAQHAARLLLQALDDCALQIRPDPAWQPTRLVSHA